MYLNVFIAEDCVTHRCVSGLFRPWVMIWGSRQLDASTLKLLVEVVMLFSTLVSSTGLQ